MNVAEAWTYPGGDGCVDFFTQCLRAAKPDIPSTATVLEIGCSEFDWLTPAHQSFPDMTLIGVDWRTMNSKPFPKVDTVRADITTPGLFPPQMFDWIVSISAIEHVGLGHYYHSTSQEPDPTKADGDILAIANAFSWLKIGGWIMFDVPYHPKRYEVIGTSHREYNSEELFMRLWCEPLARAKATAAWRHTFYCKAGHEKTLVDAPTEPHNPFYYCMMMAQRVG